MYVNYVNSYIVPACNKVHCKSITISQFSDLISSHTYLFYQLKVIGHFTPTIIIGDGGWKQNQEEELNNAVQMFKRSKLIHSPSVQEGEHLMF